MNDQDEMFEVKTEPQAAKLLACNERMRERIAEIAHLANECLLNTNHPNGYEQGQYGKDYRTYGKAMSEILKLVKERLGESVPNARKPTMDFGSFNVTRAAIPGTTILTFRRKRHVDAEHGSVVPGRIIVAKIFKSDVGKDNKLTNQFVVKSYEAGEHPRVLFSGQTWVNMSKTEKMVYKMVKCNVKETQRRHISRKRARAARSEFENGGRA